MPGQSTGFARDLGAIKPRRRWRSASRNALYRPGRHPELHRDAHAHIALLEGRTDASFGLRPDPWPTVFAEFERSMIRERVLAGMSRAAASGTRSGKPIEHSR
jgi:hypothetical protein